MVKVSTLFYRVDGFDAQNTSFTFPDFMAAYLGDQFLKDLLSPLIYDPGDDLVQAILKRS
jgi:hypothetical protein